MTSNTNIQHFWEAAMEAVKAGKLSDTAPVRVFQAAGDTNKERFEYVLTIPMPGEKRTVTTVSQGGKPKARTINALEDWFDVISPPGAELSAEVRALTDHKASERTPQENDKLDELRKDRQRYLRVIRIVRSVAEVMKHLMDKGFEVTFAPNRVSVNNPITVKAADGEVKKYPVGPFAAWDVSRIDRLPQDATIGDLVKGLREPRVPQAAEAPAIFKSRKEAEAAILNLGVYLDDKDRLATTMAAAGKEDTFYSEIYTTLPRLAELARPRATDQDKFHALIQEAMALLAPPVLPKAEPQEKLEALKTELDKEAAAKAKAFAEADHIRKEKKARKGKAA